LWNKKLELIGNALQTRSSHGGGIGIVGQATNNNKGEVAPLQNSPFTIQHSLFH
jgi:hypothetical protein